MANANAACWIERDTWRTNARRTSGNSSPVSASRHAGPRGDTHLVDVRLPRRGGRHDGAVAVGPESAGAAGSDFGLAAEDAYLLQPAGQLGDAGCRHEVLVDDDLEGRLGRLVVVAVGPALPDLDDEVAAEHGSLGVGHPPNQFPQQRFVRSVGRGDEIGRFGAHEPRNSGSGRPSCGR